MINKVYNIPVLLTSAINVSAGQTLLTDVNIRLELTLRCINFWRQLPIITNVIVCDGSGFDLSPYINEVAIRNKVANCEVLNFVNNVAGVLEKGKGYGEGEIIKYALQKSEILRNSEHFAKCTGRLWVNNYNKCIKNYNGMAAFDFNGAFKPNLIDTRFYVINKKFYFNYLIDAHEKVNDQAGYYLEHAFKERLASLKTSEYLMYPTPHIRGVSGTLGVSYQNSNFRSFLRDTRSFLIKNWF